MTTADIRHRIRLEPQGLSFEAMSDEPVLNAALRQGVPLRYGCRHGNCSSCKYLLTDGDVDFGKASPYSLSEKEREEGWALLCCARALCDLVIQDTAEPEEGLRPIISPQENEATVENVERLSRALWRVGLALARPLEFYAGQFVEVGLPGRTNEWRSYSIASSPSEPSRIELVVKRLEGGAFSGEIGRLAPGTRLSLRAPYGTGYLRAGENPTLLVAIGSGIAPILSILRQAAETGDARPFTFFYGARSQEDLVLADELEGIRARLAHFDFLPTLSAPAESGWAGSVGRVTQLVQRTIGDASGYDAYLCGAPDMCDSVALLLAAKGIADGRTFFDRFYPADDSGGGRSASLR